MLLVALLTGLGAKGQYASNIRYQSFSVQNDTLLLDSFSIVPNTLVIRNAAGEVVDPMRMS